MTRAFQMHQCIDFLGAYTFYIDDTKMIVRRETPWMIGAIAMLVLLASVSSVTFVKLQNLRRRPEAKVSYQQPRTGLVIIKVTQKYIEDGVSANCAGDTCRNTNERFNFDEALSKEDNFLSNEESFRYIVYPKKYERFVPRKNTGRRYKRYVALPRSNTNDLAELDDGVSESPKNENKGIFKRRARKVNNPMKMEQKMKMKQVRKGHIKSPSIFQMARPIKNRTAHDIIYVFGYNNRYNNMKSNVNMKMTRLPTNLSRMRRDLIDDHLAQRNASDYYAQRRAVMERYYARQREINARYANRTGNISGRSDANVFRLGYNNKNSMAEGDGATFRQSVVKINPIYGNKLGYSGTPIEPSSRRNVASGTDLGDFKPDVDLSQTRNSGNIERNALDYYVTPTPCTNISLSGTFAPKTRPKHTENCTHETERSNENSDTLIDILPKNDSDHQRWGRCDGRIVYQHNLLLGLKGPSNLDALFEVIIQGPVCITCVEAIRYNETRAIVWLDSGGRGYDFAKLQLKGYENEGFSYIIKIWGVKKIDENCDNMD